jgi:hypothetical protein
MLRLRHSQAVQAASHSHNNGAASSKDACSKEPSSPIHCTISLDTVDGPDTPSRKSHAKNASGNVSKPGCAMRLFSALVSVCGLASFAVLFKQHYQPHLHHRLLDSLSVSIGRNKSQQGHPYAPPADSSLQRQHSEHVVPQADDYLSQSNKDLTEQQETSHKDSLSKQQQQQQSLSSLNQPIADIGKQQVQIEMIQQALFAANLSQHIDSSAVHNSAQQAASSQELQETNHDALSQHYNPILTIYADTRRYTRSLSPDFFTVVPSNATINTTTSTPTINTHLRAFTFPRYTMSLQDCTDPANPSTSGIPHLPVDEFPDEDAYLPWIHDYFSNGTHVVFVAHNRRRCETGQGKEHVMHYYEPQISLFQPVAVVAEQVNYIQSSNHTFAEQATEQYTSTQTRYRLVFPSSSDTASSSTEQVTCPETRFQCYFHTSQNSTNNAAATATATTRQSWTTFSVYPFNYEYVGWRKKNNMLSLDEPDIHNNEFAQLIFTCPIPDDLRHYAQTESDTKATSRLVARHCSYSHTSSTRLCWPDTGTSRPRL